MTSSLVGSEMCIRDRIFPPAVLRVEGGGGLDHVSPIGFEFLLWFGFGTVSYTHLTLPTICSV
eukprot:5665610-Prorocentrum_lima.AAC.1